MIKQEALIYPVRINKYLAHKGFSTRRGADTLIEQKKVLINGKTAVLGDKVKETDQVEVLGNTHTADSYVYYIYNKPTDVISEDIRIENELGNTGVTKDMVRQGIFPVGRLDKYTRGLLLFTNDGRITNRVLNPLYAHDREYLITLGSRYSPSLIKILTLELKPKEIKEVSENQILIVLSGGAGDLRTVCNNLNFHINDLVRTRMLSLKLGDLKEGKFKELSQRDRETLLTELGLAA